MKKAILLTILALATSAHAEQAYSQFYVTPSGQKLEPAQAILSAVKGEPIYKCQTVEAKVSKAGTSIGIHNVKKPKVTKQD